VLQRQGLLSISPFGTSNGAWHYEIHLHGVAMLFFY